MQKCKKDLKETLNYRFEDNYMKLNSGKCHLLISGHKYEHQWTQIGKDIIGKKIELTVRNNNRQ